MTVWLSPAYGGAYRKSAKIATADVKFSSTRAIFRQAAPDGPPPGARAGIQTIELSNQKV